MPGSAAHGVREPHDLVIDSHKAAPARRSQPRGEVRPTEELVVTERARLREVAAPGLRRWASQAAIAWALGYGSLRIYWALGASPSPPPIATDLVAFTGWWSVALCGAAAVVVLGLRRARWWRPLAVAAWGVTVALVAASALLLLDVVGIILPGLGLTVHPVAFLSRAACLAGGALLGATAMSYQRSWRGACLACGSTGEEVRPARPLGPSRALALPVGQAACSAFDD